MSLFLSSRDFLYEFLLFLDRIVSTGLLFLVLCLLPEEVPGKLGFVLFYKIRGLIDSFWGEIIS